MNENCKKIGVPVFLEQKKRGDFFTVCIRLGGQLQKLPAQKTPRFPAGFLSRGEP